MDNTTLSESTIDNDEIVKENQLYFLRYPLIQKESTNEMNIKRGFFKPNNQELELEMCINVESPNFDSDRAELIAQEVDGPPENRKTSKPYFENDLVDKVRLKSFKLVKEPSKYAALTYTGKEIHLTTLKNMFQFRPTFPYLDKGAKKRKDTDHNDVSDEEEAGPSTAQPITVKFKQSDDRWKKAKSEDFQTLKAKSADEPWINCEFHMENSALSKVEKLKLFAENVEETGQAMNLTDAEYLRVLIPEGRGQATTEPSSPSHIMSLHTLRASPVLEQCRVLLKHAQIIQFQQLLMILAGGEGLTADTLLKNLPKVAVLVRGNWVVKSEVLYPSNTLSSTSGVPAELMCRTRDYVLYLFTKNQYVERKKVSSVMKIPSEEVKEIFMGFSKLSHNKGWELVLPTDNDFVVKHNDIVQKQTDAWEQKFKQLSEFLKDNKRQRRKSKSVSEESKVRNGSNYVSSDNDSGTEKNKSPVAARKNKVTKVRDNMTQEHSS
ncbi:Sin N domain containing protein [Asbolus verrucosus]|uniref:Sin N domain containing protein n=1 Tax=Asbolus verrucosus TaxID=1661398 RepID=A0A482VHP1_ASBVE|nr:Sin N domain containing protein [Asbolus verrucosus]